MNSQYRKNLKDAMTACKNYTDKKIEDLKWELGTYDLSVETINGTTMLLPTPANTIQGTMDRVDGASEKSENLIVLSDVAETTVGTLTYSIKDGVLTLNGTANGITNIASVVSSQVATMSSNYTLKWFSENISGAGGFVGFTNYYDNYISINNGTTAQSNGKLIGTSIQINSSSTFTNAKFKPMLVSGSTSPTTYKQGYTGIHNFAWTGVKVEGSNLFDASTIRYNYWAGNPSSEPTNYSSQFISVQPNTTYYISGTIGSYHNVKCYDENQTAISTLINNTTTRMFTTPSDAYYIVYSANTGSGANVPSTIMISKGNSAPSDYVPYITPTTTTIDLSSILYNGSPLFENNSLKGVGTAKDYITPYLAHKQISSYTFTGNETLTEYTRSSDNNKTYAVAISDRALTTNVLFAYFDLSTATAMNNMADNSYRGATDTTSVIFYSTSYQTSASMLAFLTGKTIYFELATPIEVDIDLSQLVKFEAYSNGLITLVNTNNQDTTSTFKYLKEVAE